MTTDAPAILLVTTSVDIASDYVVEALTRLGAPHFRLNTEDLPLAAKSSACLKDGRLQWFWRSEHSPTPATADTLRTVWFRRMRQRAMPPDILPAHAEYCLRESEWFVRGTLFGLDQSVPESRWMSHPTRVLRAESKIEQLRVAGTVGLRCPATLISNDPSQIRAFFAANRCQVIAKPLRLGYFDYGQVQTCVYTTKLTEDDLKQILVVGR